MKSYLGTGAAARRWTWWVAAAAIAAAARGGYSLSTVTPRGLPYVTGALVLTLIAVAAVAGLLARGGGPARGLLLYVASLVAVGAPSFVPMVRLLIMDPACSTMGAFSTRGELVDRGLTVLLASMLFGAGATALYGASSPGESAPAPMRHRARRGAVLIGGAILIYGIGHIASYYVEVAASAIPGGWTSCVRATASGITDLPLTVGIDLLSGFDEEVAFTGVALLVLGRAPRARTAAVFAATGGALRAVMHFYYTVEAPWWSFLSVFAWTLTWSGLTLLGCYLLLRLGRAWSVPAIAAVTVATAIAHSTMNLTTDSAAVTKALTDQGHSALAWVFNLGIILVLAGLPIVAACCGFGPLTRYGDSWDHALRAWWAARRAPSTPGIALDDASASASESEDREPESAG